MDCATRIVDILRSPARLILAAVGLLICISTAGMAAADKYASRHKLQNLLRQGDFETLEQTLAGLERAYDAGRISDDIVDHAYYAFSSADPAFDDQFAKWIAAKPRSHRPLLGRGVYRRNLGWVYRGEAFFSETAETRIDLMVRHFRLAEQDLLAALKLKPNSGVAYSYLIEMQIATGSDKRRDALLREGLRADPSSLAIRRRYFFGLLPWWGGGRGTVSDARYPVMLSRRLHTFARSVESDAAGVPRLKPILGYLDYTVAHILRRERRYEEAASFYQQAIAISDHWQFHDGAGENYLRMGRYDDAIAAYSHALQLRPGMQAAYKSRAAAFRSMGRFDKALDDLNTALALAPNDPDYLLLKAKTLLQMGRPRDALAALDAALVYGEFDDEVWLIRGSVYLYHFSDGQRALPDLQRARELAPDKFMYRIHILYARVLSWV